MTHPLSLRLLMPLAAFAVLAALLGAGLKSDPQALPSPLVGKAAPAFKLVRLDDAARAFEPQELRGKAWVFNVWASWCTSCRQEHAVLLDLSQRGLAPIVGLNYMDGQEAGARFLQAHGNPYQLSVLDPGGRTGIDYGVVGVPETFVIDRQGVIRYKSSGPLTAEQVEQKIVPLLKELNRG